METEKRLSVGRLLAELEQRLRSSKENISSQEANILMQLKANALRGFTIGLTGGSVLGWLGCWKLPHLLRLGVTAGAGFGAGLKCFSWSINSGADYVLSLEGTRMQREFQMMMLNTYHDVPSVMRRSANHFYSEEVYDDTSDKPRLRWRFRNFYGEVAADSAENKDHDTFVENSNQERTASKKINPTMKQTQTVSTEADNNAENPFDCIFGISASQEVPSSEPSIASQRRHRAHKRYHRRHRRRHTDASDASEV